MSTLHLKGTLPADALLVNGVMTSTMLDIYGNHVDDLEAMKGKQLDITIREHRDRRSTQANALCWELCSQIGQAIFPPIGKDEVYRRAIKAVGIFDLYQIPEDALDTFTEGYERRGTGWFVEVVDDSPLRGWVMVHAYHGSSTYDTKQMSILIDYLIDEAQQMELTIGYDLRELERIKEAWKGERHL